MSHTPGPWIATFENDRWVIDCQGEFGPKKALAVTAGFYPTNEANARLIAAAPELLEALKKAEAMLIDIEHAAGGGDDEIYVEGAILTIRAAIKKATGGAV